MRTQKSGISFLTFLLPVLLSVILFSLDNIQEDIDDPFDGIGEDDVAINSDKFIQRLDK